jgi:hypothetical protein
MVKNVLKRPSPKVSFSIVGLILIGLLVMILVACNPGRQSEPERVYSPSGGRVILPSVNYIKDDIRKYLCVKLTIQNVVTGSTLFEIQTGVSDRMRWSVQWIGEKIIQFKSSDIGDYCWAENSDGTWHDWDCPP